VGAIILSLKKSKLAVQTGFPEKMRPPFAAASNFRRAVKCVTLASPANRNGAKIELWSRSVFIKSIRIGAIAFDVDQNPWFHGRG
jgi:hypothetical protein